MVLAPAAQRVIVAIAHGQLPHDDDPQHACPLRTRHEVSIARVLFRVAIYIIERAYPQALYADATLHNLLPS